MLSWTFQKVISLVQCLLHTRVSASHPQAVQCHPVECSDAAQESIYGKNGGEISVYSCVNFSGLQGVPKALSCLQVREDALCCLILGREDNCSGLAAGRWWPAGWVGLWGRSYSHLSCLLGFWSFNYAQVGYRDTPCFKADPSDNSHTAIKGFLMKSGSKEVVLGQC